MIPFIDIKAQLARIEDDMRGRIDAVLKHAKFIMGPEVAELEAELVSFTGSSHCVTSASGTDALLLALMALKVGPGDAVFTTPFTFIATAEVISLLGATPVFVDIERGTYNLDPNRLDEAVRAVKEKDASLHPLPAPAVTGNGLKPAAVIAVDLYGLPADYKAIKAVAAQYGVPVIADAAQSFGAEYWGRKAVRAADIACTSFFPAKPLGCLGDGGAVFTDNDDLAAACRSIRLHGVGAHKYDNARTGLNARLDTLQAAVLLAKLKIFRDELEKRREVAAMYSAKLARLEGVTLPPMPENAASAWAQYTLRSPNRDAIQESLKQDGTPSVVYYPCPLHQQTAYADLNYQPGSFPEAEAASQEVFSIPMHPYLDERTIGGICQCIQQSEMQTK